MRSLRAAKDTIPPYCACSLRILYLKSPPALLSAAPRARTCTEAAPAACTNAVFSPCHREIWNIWKGRERSNGQLLRQNELLGKTVLFSVCFLSRVWVTRACEVRVLSRALPRCSLKWWVDGESRTKTAASSLPFWVSTASSHRSLYSTCGLIYLPTCSGRLPIYFVFSFSSTLSFFLLPSSLP